MPKCLKPETIGVVEADPDMAASGAAPLGFDRRRQKGLPLRGPMGPAALAVDRLNLCKSCLGPGARIAPELRLVPFHQRRKASDMVRAREDVEELIRLEEYYAIEAETVEGD